MFLICSALMMAQNQTESTWEINNYGKYIHQFPPNTIKSIRQYERINKKICRQKMSIIFNEICICIHTHIYICMYLPTPPSQDLLHTDVKEPSLPYYLSIVRYFSKILMQCRLQTVLIRIWTQIAKSVSYDGNHYTSYRKKF